MVENITFFNDSFAAEEINERVTNTSNPAAFSAFKAPHQVARLCNGAKFDAATSHLPVHDRAIKGDPTDTTLLCFSETLSIPELSVVSPCPDVSPSIAVVRRAGVRVFMVTDDFKLTAIAIARQVGFLLLQNS